MIGARFSRTWLWLLLAAALFTRAALPQGYMPARSDTGAIAVKVCGSGHIWLVPLEKHAGDSEDQQRADQPCAFAGFASAEPPSTWPSLPLPAVVSLAFAELPAAVESTASARILPPATGPPLPA